MLCAALTLSLCSVFCGCSSNGSESTAEQPHSHTFGEWVAEVPATCIEAGTKGHKDCSGCNKHFDKDGVEITDLTIAIDADAHDFSKEWSKNETHHWNVCTRNGCNGVSDNEEHTFNDGEITTPATFEADGVKTLTCTVCGQTKTEKIDKLTHNYSEEWSKDTDKHWHACTDEGYETLKKDEAAHTFGEGVVTTPATFDSEGVKTFTCTVCGQTKTEKIDKLESVTISFSGIERNSIRIEKGTTTEIEEPAKADNVFVNWTNADGKVVDVTAVFNEDITLTANFKEGYNFKKNHAGATATTTMEGATAGSVTESSIFETGIRYNFPSRTSDSNYYVVTLPCINYSKFTVVTFNWKAMGWTQVGLKNSRGHMQTDFSGSLQVVKVGNEYKAIWMNYEDKSQCWTETISDTDIINGTKGLDYVYALTYNTDRWLDIEVGGVSHDYNDGVLQRVAISDGGDKIIANSENVYNPGVNTDNWTVALQAIDYTKYASVTFTWKFNNAKAWLGLNSARDIVEKNEADDKAMNGTLVITKNEKGKYVATLTNTSVDGGTCTKELSADVANGKKGLVIYFGSSTPWRQFSVVATPTYEVLPAE